MQSAPTVLELPHSRWNAHAEVTATDSAPLLVRTFADSGDLGAAGGGCLVAVRLEHEPSSEELCKRLAVADHRASFSTCTVFVRRHGGSSYSVRWFSSGGSEYRCCGHGSMAVGFEAYKRWGSLESLPLKLVNDSSPMISVDVDEDGKVEMSLDTRADTAFSVTKTGTTESACDALGLERASVTLQGTWSLGIVIVLSSARRVTELRPDFGRMRQLDARNVIVAAFEGIETHHDIVYRVFCPRLGVQEDAATGTSMAVLAELYAKEFGCPGEWLRGLQASRSPSELEAMFCPGQPSPVVRLRGRCAES